MEKGAANRRRGDVQRGWNHGRSDGRMGPKLRRAVLGLSVLLVREQGKEKAQVQENTRERIREGEGERNT